MSGTEQFWMTFAAVLGANLLTVMFVMGAIKVYRDERDKGDGNSTFVGYTSLALPGVFLLFALYSTLY